MLCFGRRTLTVLLPVGEARRRSLREVMMRLATAYNRWKKKDKITIKIKIRKGDYYYGEEIYWD